MSQENPATTTNTEAAAESSAKEKSAENSAKERAAESKSQSSASGTAPKKKLTSEEKAKRKKRKRILRIFYYAIPAVLLVLFIVFGILFLKDYREYRIAKKAYDELDTYVEEKGVVKARSVVPSVVIPTEGAEEIADAFEDTSTGEVTFEYPELDIDYAALKHVNPDFVGVLYIPSLELRYPVVHSKDNQEYLKKTYDGTANSAGAVFLDYTASADMEDRNTFVFGHNMKNGSMFGSLKKFTSDESLAANDPYVYFYTSDCVRKYEIFSYYFSFVGSDAYQNFTGDQGYDEYVRKAKTNSLFVNDEVDLKRRPKILTLSTCSGTEHVKRLLVHCALIGKATY